MLMLLLQYKVMVYDPAERAIHSPYFYSTPNIYSVGKPTGARIVCRAIMNSDTGLLLVCSTHTPPVCTIETLFTFYTGLIGHAMHPL